jgi:hypothetical protein
MSCSADDNSSDITSTTNSSDNWFIISKTEDTWLVISKTEDTCLPSEVQNSNIFDDTLVPVIRDLEMSPREVDEARLRLAFINFKTDAECAVGFATAKSEVKRNQIFWKVSSRSTCHSHGALALI